MYLLNDVVDIENDRKHESKRFRPFAAGQLSLLVGWILWPILLILSFILAVLFLPNAFAFVLAIYFFITVLFLDEIHFKRFVKIPPMLDICK